MNNFYIKNKSWLTITADLLFIASVWFISLLILDPSGNFPLNDDWSFGLTVKKLIESGDFRPLGWGAMPLLTNVLWGALFCIHDGFSFEALRLSTLTISLLGSFGLYFLIKDTNQTRWHVFISVFSLCFNPIYYALSNTFMTDVLFTSMLILSSFFLSRAITRTSTKYLLIGIVFLVLATLSRQLALSIGLAYSLSYLLKNGFSIKNIITALIPLFISAGILIIYQKWLSSTGRMPALYNVKNEQLFNYLLHPRQIIPVLTRSTFIVIHYLGLFLLPVLLYGLMVIAKTQRNLHLTLVGVVFSALLGYGYIQFGNISFMPLLGNIFIKSGIGPLTLSDTYILGINNVPSLSMVFWRNLTLLSCFGAALLTVIIFLSFVRIIKELKLNIKPNNDLILSVFFLSSGIIYLAPLLLNVFFDEDRVIIDIFDRYLIPAVPLFTASIYYFCKKYGTLSKEETNDYKIYSSVIIFLLMFFSVGATKDYLSWNKYRWQALYDLQSNIHASLEDIDGGFEFNGLYLYDSNYQPKPSLSWWWVSDDLYRVTFGAIPGYSVAKEYSYINYIPHYNRKIYILKRL